MSVFCRCREKMNLTDEVNAMNADKIMITVSDYGRIMNLIDQLGDFFSKEQKENMEKLKAELRRAVKVDSSNMPRDRIRINTTFEIKAVEEMESRTLSLVFPDQANMEKNRLSILSPVGTAVLGYRVGDIIQWRVPAGKKRFIITKILYQPEASEDYHL